MSSVEKIRQLKKLVNEANRILVWQTEIYEAIHNIDLDWIPDLDWAHISDLFPRTIADLILNTELQRGSDTTNAGGDATVTFPTAFAAAPLVFLQGVDAGAKGIVLDVVSKSTTQVVVKARKVTGITSGAGTAHNHTFSDSFNTSLVSAGTPSGTLGNHDSSVQAGILIQTAIERYCAIVSGGSPTFAFLAVTAAYVSHDYLYGDHIHVFTGDLMDTHRHTGTASGTTGNESAHTHPVAAPVLAIAFDWLAVKA